MFKEFVDCRNRSFGALSFVLFVLLLSLFLNNDRAIAAELSSQIEIFKALPEAKSLNSDKNMKLTDFYLTELENQECFVFSKSKVCELNNAILGYMYNNGESVGKSYGFLLSQINIATRIAKDVPELSEKIQEINKKFDKIYGPAVLQILYFINKIDDYKVMLPDKILKDGEPNIIELSKDNPQVKLTMPYLFGNKYEKESSLNLLRNIEPSVSDKNMTLALCNLLCFHPKALISDSEYIINNLCWETSYNINVEGEKHKFSIKIPRFWDIKSKNEKDDFTLFHLISPLDNLAASYRSFAYIEGVTGNTPKEFYENLEKEEIYIKTILNESNITINKISIEKLGYDDVMVIEYQTPDMKDNSGLYRTCRSYIFLLDKKIIAYNYSVGAVYKNDCKKAMERNIPLFEKIVKYSLDSYYNN